MILTISHFLYSFSLLDFRWCADSNQIHSTRLPQRLLPRLRPCSLSLFRFGSTSAIDDFLFRKPHDVTLFRLPPTSRISSFGIRSCAHGTSACLRHVLVLLMINSTAELRRLGWIAGDTDHGDAGTVRATRRLERLRLYTFASPHPRSRSPRHIAHECLIVIDLTAYLVPFTSTSCYLRHYHLLTSYLPFPDLPPRAPPPPRSLSTCSPSPRPPLSTDCIILMLIIVVFCKCLGRRMRRRDGSNMRDVGGRTSRTRRVGETQRREKMCLGLNRLRNTCVSCGRGT
ncbi:hypothetical protein B0H10DRAFT_1041112 [Mycena sp. CBHHK59/15]|nr:hypothetical protein B0H10DRAFT_1041112 [Mycena sp. CBHHK59/15]